MSAQLINPKFCTSSEDWVKENLNYSPKKKIFLFLKACGITMVQEILEEKHSRTLNYCVFRESVKFSLQEPTNKQLSCFNHQIFAIETELWKLAATTLKSEIFDQLKEKTHPFL